MARGDRCTAAPCERPTLSRGLCAAHYKKWRAAGSPEMYHACSCGELFVVGVTKNTHCSPACRKQAQYRAKKAARDADPELVAADLAARRARHAALDPDVKAARNRKATLAHYGLTEEDYANLLSEQGGVCAICRKTPKGSLAVDHDHKTKSVRGLLCAFCNHRVLGGVHGVDILRSALAYLENPPAAHVVPNAKVAKEHRRRRRVN